MTTTKREQVEAMLRARGFVEDEHGDWRRGQEAVMLDLRQGPEFAWVGRFNDGGVLTKTTLTYDEVLKRF